jgi:pimeloyl-ACP methyl ester carboxylesterase
MRFCFFVLFLACSTTEAQEIVTVASRPGVTQSFFVAGMGERRAEAVALLYVGGGGIIRLRLEGGQPKFGANNFLPRSRGEFIRDGVLPVVMDAPSDQTGGLTDYYRSSGQQAADARAVLAELKKRFPRLPVFLVGTSRGTISAAFLGRALGDEVAGVVLTSTLFVSPRGASLAGFDYASIKAPLLFVHHREDGCEQTPYTEAHRLAARYPLVSVKGGKPPESGPCDPFAPHGFWGKEPQTVDAIAGWMLKKPYPREID